MSIGHWDRFGTAYLMERFGLSDQLKRKFAECVGRPATLRRNADLGRIMTPPTTAVGQTQPRQSRRGAR
jgi:hypothetical protein